VIREVVQELCLAESEAVLRVEDLLDGPWIRPEDVPVFFGGALLPPAALKVLNETRLVKVGFPL